MEVVQLKITIQGLLPSLHQYYIYIYYIHIYCMSVVVLLQGYKTE